MFAYWSDTKGNIYYDNPMTVTVTENTTYTARFTTGNMLVVASNSEEMGKVSGGGVLVAGKKQTIKATPNEGYVFEHWRDDKGNEYTTATLEVGPFESGTTHIYTAFFRSEKYEVKVVSADETMGDVYKDCTVSENETVTLYAYPEYGYMLDYWKDDKGNKYTDNDIEVGPYKGGTTHTFTAYFTKLAYSITAVSENSDFGSVTGGNAHAYDGEEVTLTAKPAEGYDFIRWEDQYSYEYFDNPLTITASDDLELTAIFKEKIKVTQEPKMTYYFDPEGSVKISLMAEGDDLTYKLYYKKSEEESYTYFDEIDCADWTGNYEFKGLSGTGISEEEDGMRMYWYIENYDGQSVKYYFTLKKYTKTDVDRHIHVYSPHVGQTYADYFANIEHNVTANAFTLDKDAFFITVYDYDGNLVEQSGGNLSMQDEDVFYTGYKYELNIKMYLPEDVSPSVLDQLKDKGLLYLSSYHLSADVINKEEGYFIIYWEERISAGQTIGDINHDGFITKEDGEVFARYIAGWDDTEIETSLADINGDGDVDLLDSLILSRYLEGWTGYETYFSS